MCFLFVKRLFLCCRSFKVHPLASHLKPVGKKSLAASDTPSTGPFIFSSLRRNAKEVKKTKSKTTKCFFFLLVSVKHRLQTGGKIQTEGKMQPADQELNADFLSIYMYHVTCIPIIRLISVEVCTLVRLKNHSS